MFSQDMSFQVPFARETLFTVAARMRSDLTVVIVFVGFEGTGGGEGFTAGVATYWLFLRVNLDVIISLLFLCKCFRANITFESS